MKKLMLLLGAFMLAALMMSCEKDFLNEEAFKEVPTDAFQKSLLKGVQSGMSSNAATMNFRAHLSGMNEVPSNESMATGQAIFMVNKEMTEVKYRLIVANLENVRMAHIHAAPAGVNGGVVAWLYPSMPPPVTIEGTTNGILAEGTLTSESLSGSLEGMEISDLVNLMKSAEVYVNVHTDQYPTGEIRGQIMSNKGRN